MERSPQCLPQPAPPPPGTSWVSSYLGRDRGDALTEEVQLERIQQWCAVADLELLDVLRDIDRSGKDFDARGRPAFDELLARLDAGEAGAVVVYRTSRFGRDFYETVRTVRRLREQGIQFHSAQERVDLDSTTGRLTLDKAAEPLAALDVRREYWALGSAPEPASGGLVPDPVTGPAVTEAFAMRAGGAPYHEILAMLNRDAPRPAPRLWTHTHVPRMLGLRVYLGEVRQGDLVVPDAHEPLTDEATFAAAQVSQRRPRFRNVWPGGRVGAEPS